MTSDAWHPLESLPPAEQTGSLHHGGSAARRLFVFVLYEFRQAAVAGAERGRACAERGVSIGQSAYGRFQYGGFDTAQSAWANDHDPLMLWPAARWLHSGRLLSYYAGHSHLSWGSGRYFTAGAVRSVWGRRFSEDVLPGKRTFVLYLLLVFLAGGILI